MGSAIDHETVALAKSVLDWWHAAGVDTLVEEAPRHWLADTSALSSARLAAPARASAVPAQSASPAPTVLPDTLAGFVEWFLHDTAILGEYPVRRRISPEGDVAGGVMIVTDVPEAGDVEAGHLLTGEAGQLLDKMLAALGRDRASVYLATLAPARPATGRLDDATVDDLAPSLLHHIALAAPAKLWLLGRAASRAVLGMDEAQAAGKLHSVNHGGVKVDTIATVHPRILIREASGDRRERPLRKKAWETMQMLMESTPA